MMETKTIQYSPVPYPPVIEAINTMEEAGWAVRQVIDAGDDYVMVVYERDIEPAPGWSH